MGALLLGVAMAAGCRDDDDGGGGRGELGYASFRWGCAGEGDVACVDERVRGFGNEVALGSVFEVGFGLASHVPVDAGGLELAGGSRASAPSNHPASHPYANGYGHDGCDYDYDDPACGYSFGGTGSFSADETGQVTLLALADDGTVADFVTLWITTVSSLAIVRDCQDESCEADGDVVATAEVGEDLALRVEPYRGGELLVGHLDYAFRSLDPEVAQISAQQGHRATVQLLRAGTAFVQVEGGGRTDTVAITVVSEGPQRRRPDGPGDDDGSTGGSGTDTGTATDEGSGTETDTDTETDTGTETGTSTGGMQ